MEMRQSLSITIIVSLTTEVQMSLLTSLRPLLATILLCQITMRTKMKGSATLKEMHQQKPQVILMLIWSLRLTLGGSMKHTQAASKVRDLERSSLL